MKAAINTIEEQRPLINQVQETPCDIPYFTLRGADGLVRTYVVTEISEGKEAHWQWKKANFSLSLKSPYTGKVATCMMACPSSSVNDIAKVLKDRAVYFAKSLTPNPTPLDEKIAWGGMGLSVLGGLAAFTDYNIIWISAAILFGISTIYMTIRYCYRQKVSFPQMIQSSIEINDQQIITLANAVQKFWTIAPEKV